MLWLWLAVFVTVVIFGFSVFRGSPYVPSHKSDVIRSLTELYKLSNKDVLVDIGSGDGVVLREAAKIGARAIGYEINPILVLVSRLLSIGCKKVNIKFADFWLSSLPKETTVIYVFTASRDIKSIIKKIQKETNKLRQPIHLISYGAKLGDMRMVNSIGAHHLYVFNPLQPDKAQV